MSRVANKLLIEGPQKAPFTVVLAHGAGAPMDSPFMSAVAAGLSGHGLRVVRFEFPYMAARRAQGARKPPDRAPVLLDCWRAVIDQLGHPERLIIGGKSMGGRMASLIADDAHVAGLLVFGYPFHAPGKPPGDRIAHLAHLKTPALIVQGTRDALGTREDIAAYRLSKSIGLCWIEDGDHSLKPRKKSGLSEDDALTQAIDAAAEFIRQLPA